MDGDMEEFNEVVYRVSLCLLDDPFVPSLLEGDPWKTQMN